MGTLLTFNLSSNVSIESEPVHVVLPTETTNLIFTQDLTNTGTEPVVPKGVVAILGDQGRLVGKAAFETQRLLPAEKLTYHAQYADSLKPGGYHAMCTFEYEGKTETKQIDFTVQ